MKRLPVVRWLAVASAVLLSAGAFSPVRAQADPDDVKRAVARISLTNGDVSVRRGDSEEWVAAVINAPLVAGDYISTSPNARAEVQFDASNVLRIADDAEVRMAQLEYSRYQLELARGTVTYRVLRDTDVDVELDTPNISIRPSRKGVYRITVNDAGETEVAVRSGAVEIYSPRGTEWVRSGQTLIARGSASDPEYRLASATPRDEWDRWNDDRDRAELESASYKYVPQGVYGVSDLDRSGHWVYVPDYGYCWEPMVSVGWAPYSNGRWAWSDWYGWTWVSYDPWGWAPYHYGRWFYRDRWMWYPGVIGTRHYWSPALVAFIGWGSGGVGIGFGNIGWIPLAPYETLHPWWGRSYYGRPNFINRNINITNVNITNVYVNSRVRNAVIGVRSDDFEHGRFGSPGRFTGDQLRQVGIVRGGVPITPQVANLRFSDRQVNNLPRTSPNARFFSRQQQGNGPQRISFEQQRRAFEQAGFGGGQDNGRPRDSFIGSGAQGRGNAPEPARGAQPAFAGREGAGGGGRQNAPEAQRPAGRDTFLGNGNPQNGGWRRFGERENAPAQANQPAQGGRPAENENAAQPNRGNAWQRFGAPSGRQVNPRAQEPPPQAERNNGWSRFGSPSQGNPNPREQRQAPEVRNDVRSEPRQASPREQAPQFSAPRERPSAPAFNPAPRERPSAPAFNPAPRERPSAPAFSAPRSEGGNRPAMSAPRTEAPRGGGNENRGGGGGETRGRNRGR